MKDGYYYLHTNGDLIWRNAFVVDSDVTYFDSDFVKRHWPINVKDRGTAYHLVYEALALGARIERVTELASKWGLTKEDSFEYLIRHPNPTDDETKGIDIFITEILGMEMDAYWLAFAAWGKRRGK
jgi:hypothetical protein